jgi:uncharacterized metal-binding protein
MVCNTWSKTKNIGNWGVISEIAWMACVSYLFGLSGRDWLCAGRAWGVYRWWEPATLNASMDLTHRCWGSQLWWHQLSGCQYQPLDVDLCYLVPVYTRLGALPSTHIVAVMSLLLKLNGHDYPNQTSSARSWIHITIQLGLRVGVFSRIDSDMKYMLLRSNIRMRKLACWLTNYSPSIWTWIRMCVFRRCCIQGR